MSQDSISYKYNKHGLDSISLDSTNNKTYEIN